MAGSLNGGDFKVRIDEYPITDIVFGERTALEQHPQSSPRGAICIY